MKVLIINPSGGYTHEYPPLGLLYIASTLRLDGHEVGFFDAGARRPDGTTLMQYIDSFRPDVCGVAVYTTNVVTTFETIREIKRSTGCKIVVGGPHATVLPERTMFECAEIDYLVCGEGELTFRDLLRCMASSCDISTVAGLYYRGPDGLTASNAPREFIEDLDTIPLPAYDLITDFGYTFDVIKVGRKLGTIMTSRGCPYDCAFCAAKAVWRRSFRRRSPASVVDEMILLRDKYGYDEIYFMDDLFAVNRKWLDEFYALLEARNVRMPWKCLGRVDLLGYEDYLKMARHGCYLIQFGVESGDNTVIADIGKGINTYQVRQAFSEARRAGLNTYGFFILGHRLDTYESALKTIYFARDLTPDFVSFFCMVPFPGTKLYAMLPDDLKYDWSKIMYSGWGRGLPPIKLSAVDPKDLLKLEWEAHIKVYTSPAYVVRNILLPRRLTQLRRLKIKAFALHFSAYIYNRLRGRWAFARFGRMDLTGALDKDSFKFIWKDWKKITDFGAALDNRRKERPVFLDVLRRAIKESGARSVLEIGSGTALDTHILALEFPDVEFHASDISAEAVELGEAIGKSVGSSVKFTVADAASLPYKDGEFDMVFSQGVMEHFRDPMPALREQARVLRGGGTLIVDVPQKYNPYTLFKHARIREGIWPYGWESEFSAGELKGIGRTLGVRLTAMTGYGYGFFQDYGFSLPVYLLKAVAEKGGVLGAASKAALKGLSLIERAFGQYFLQNIVATFKK